jgi:protease IV
MKNRKVLLSVLLILTILGMGGCAFVTIDLMSLMRIPSMHERVLYKGTEGKVLVVEILGLITTTGVRQMLSSQEGTYERLDSIMNIADKDPRIKAMIIKIDSPGGSVTASDLVYRQIIDFKTKKKIPAVACITNMGASGAYMIALSADRIVALPTSMVGNVGVFIPFISFQGLMDMLGVRDETIASGKYKVAGSPKKDMTEEDKAIYKTIVDEMYADFMAKVKKNRPAMTDADIKIVGDGRVMAANTAMNYHAIDEVGYYEEALKSVNKIAGITNPTVVVYRRDGEKQGGFYSWP